METTRMSNKELRYAEIISQVTTGKIRQSQAAQILLLSLRQIKRLCKRYRLNGIAGLAHGNRGKSSNNKICENRRNKILNLIKAKYLDFGPQLIHEQLYERHQILISSEWIRQVMIQEGLWKAKETKTVKTHQRRNRRSRKGELVQIDGSYHKWFEDRGEKCCLLVAIDDATSELLELEFVSNESTKDYMHLMTRYIKRRGRPICLYSDRLNVFRGKNCQFKRALNELDIGLINANSPQAKGRVERANATLQDRLIKLMRLEGIDTLEAGNQYLEKYRLDHNKRYARKAKDPQDDHRSISEEISLKKILCEKEERKVGKDLSIRFKNKTYILKNETCRHRLSGKTAIVFKVSDQVYIEIEGKQYEYKIYEEQPFEEASMNRKELDSWLDRKPHMTAIQRDRLKRKGL